MSGKEKFKPYAAAYLVLVNGEQILLSKRLNTGYQDGNYSLIAGHFEGGETAKDCIIREASEEAGIMLSLEDLEVVHVVHRLTPQREYFDIYLRAKKWSGEIVNMEPDKCDKLAWYGLDCLPLNILPEVEFVLENINKNIHYSEFGWRL